METTVQIHAHISSSANVIMTGEFCYPPSPFILMTRIILMMLKKISEVSLISSQFQARVSLLTEWASPCKLAGLLEWQILALLCAASVIIVPSCCFSVGCDLSPGTVPPPLLEPLVQLADSVTVVLMTHCFTWCHPQSTFFFFHIFFILMFSLSARNRLSLHCTLTIGC